MKRKSGFTILELMIVVAIISIVAAVALPSVQESRKAAAQTQAIGVLKMTVTVSEQYAVRFESYPSTQADLVNAGLLPDSNNSPNSGYLYEFSSTRFSWQMSANPKIPGITGNSYFFIDQSGVIRFNTVGPADALSTAVD